MMMKSINLAILAAIFTVLAAGCASHKNPAIAKMLDRKEIRVGVEANFKPLIFKDGKNLKGLEPDLMAEIGDITGAKMTVKEMPWNELIPSLEAGKIDIIMSGMTITEERKRKVNFTQPYIKAGQMAIMRTDNIKDFSAADKVISTNRKVGYINGTTGNFFVNEKCAKAVKTPFAKPSEGIIALADGKIDVFIIDAPIVWDLSNPKLTPLFEPLTEEYLGWAVRKDDRTLLDTMNKCLEQMKKDGSLGSIEKRWVPQLLLN
ncbi:MAG: ABC transporter substrate-binding protein [Victivallales bacterium]|jgi:polar amino acid transport system substrate-binding protein